MERANLELSAALREYEAEKNRMTTDMERSVRDWSSKFLVFEVENNRLTTDMERSNLYLSTTIDDMERSNLYLSTKLDECQAENNRLSIQASSLLTRWDNFESHFRQFMIKVHKDYNVAHRVHEWQE